MSLTITLLGRPAITTQSGADYQFRSQKSWALLAYLLLGERAPSRRTLAALLFSEADDPLRALRWNLAELRRALRTEGTVEGDPVELTLPTDAVVDVFAVTKGRWTDAVHLPGLGSELLEAISVRAAEGFESWLHAERGRMAAAAEAILHEAALGSLTRGSLADAIGYAERATAMSPLDENHQALLIGLYRNAGDDRSAERQYAACTRLLATELGVSPGPAVESAFRDARAASRAGKDDASIAALVEAGVAAVSVGAVEAGVVSLRTAVQLADAADDAPSRVMSRQALAEALIHSVRGLDEEGLATLFAAEQIAQRTGDSHAMAQARAELGYVDFLRARYDRAEHWLNDARERAQDSPAVLAKATIYLGCVASDRADYRAATELLNEALTLSRRIPDIRREAYAVSMLGRIHLLRGDFDEAVRHLDSAIALSEQGHWLAFLPWPQAMRGEVDLAQGDVAGGTGRLEHAFARACQLGDPCWEGMAARGLALAAEAKGDVESAFAILSDARIRCNRVADPYVWLDAYILDGQCQLGRTYGHPDTETWVHTMGKLAARTSMHEMTVRALLHAAATGDPDAAAGAALLARGIDNPELLRLLAPPGGLG